MSKFIYSTLVAAVLIAGVTPAVANEHSVDGQEYSTAAARAFWERMDGK